MEIQERSTSIKFGKYPQTANGDIQPIEWLVLAKEENKMLVISKYALDCKRFDGSSNNWKNSEIRQWANNDFYNKAFDDKEKKYINPFDGDNVFLLSKDEAEKYFVNDEARRCKATEYAVKNGAWVADSSYGSNAGYSWWWLCSSHYSNCVYYINNDGDSYYYDSVDFANYVFRPALWINL